MVYRDLLLQQDKSQVVEDSEHKTQEVDHEILFRLKKNRTSTSSEDQVNTSDDLVNIDCEKFIADCAVEASRRPHVDLDGGNAQESEENPFHRSDQMIKDAEGVRSRMVSAPGRSSLEVGKNQIASNAVSTTSVDDNYMAVGGHIDSVLEEKIINFEYVDFSRLIPKDKITKVEDHRFELVVRGGSTFFAPVSEHETTSIANFSCLKQAFRIYSNILTRVYHAKASELIQYNHTIYTAALSFVWDNVYQYDKEFRMHISKFPQRSWSVILQQAWSMCLKDRVKGPDDIRTGGGSSGKPNRGKEPCRRFNQGKCYYGARCIFDHHCSVKKCGKFGHGDHICRLRNGEGTSSTDVLSGNPKPTVAGNSNANNNKK